MLGRLLSARTWSSEIDLDPGSAALGGRSTRAQLEQVIVNLVLNAQNAMPGGGRLSIETRPVDDGEGCLIRVTDTGVGMSAETMGKMFEPFFTTRAESGGTGLGLSTVYGTAVQSGGRVDVESELGEGTTISVYLPATHAAVEQGPRPGGGAKGGGFRGGGEKVLVVEDNPLVRRVATKMLESLGYSTLEAEDGPTALELLAATGGSIDLLLTDVVLPKMDGPTLAGVLRGRMPDLPVLFMSGHLGAGVDEAELNRLGRALQKPFDRGTLARAVRGALDG